MIYGTTAQLLAGTALAALLLCPAPRAEDFPSWNVVLLERIPLVEFATDPSVGSDLWGYVSAAGHEIVLLTLEDVVAVIDLDTAGGPTIVAEFSYPSINAADVKTYLDYAYVGNEGGGGLAVLDLSQVDAGTVTLVTTVTEGGLDTIHNMAVNPDTASLYLCGTNLAADRLIAMDLTDPAAPAISGIMPLTEGGETQDTQVVTMTSGPYAGKDLAFTASGLDGLEIYDVTDPAAMFRVSQTFYPNLGSTHQGWLSDDRQYFYLNDERDDLNETLILDVSDPGAPSIVGTYGYGVTATDHNHFVKGDRIYETDYRGGFRIFDLTDPENPVAAGYFDTFPGNDEGGLGGAWSVYPYFPSGRIVVSDRSRGLFVLWEGSAPIDITLPSGPLGHIDPAGDTFDVTVDAAAGHTLAAGSEVLVYDIGAGEVEVPLTLTEGSTGYVATLPPLPCGAVVQHHLRAATTTGLRVRFPENPWCNPLMAVVGESVTTVYQDDFESAPTWTVGAPGDTATGGVWEHVNPLGTVAPMGTDPQPEIDHTPSGTRCYVTGQGTDELLLAENDVDEGKTTLTSPVFDLSGGEKATISYWRWYDNSFETAGEPESDGPHEDVFNVFVSNDDGASWMLVERVGPGGDETFGGWHHHAFDVGSLVPLTDEVRLRFVATDLGMPSVVEAAVDDVSVYTVDCGTFTDLGGGTAGIAGVPSLTGQGDLAPGSTFALHLQNAPASVPIVLFLSTTSIPFPYAGGTLHPIPFDDFLILGTNADGELLASTTWPTGLPPGVQVWWQYIVADGSVPWGVTLSNGLVSVTP